MKKLQFLAVLAVVTLLMSSPGQAQNITACLKTSTGGLYNVQVGPTPSGACRAKDSTIQWTGVLSFPIGNTRGGTGALISNTTGNSNSAYGVDALQFNTTGDLNTASGSLALQFNTIGNDNTASGFRALRNNTIGLRNTASGSNALQNNTTGNDNTASGFQALLSNTTGFSNTASGFEALRNNTTGRDNTASGSQALRFNTTGEFNTASGARALRDNTTGVNNTASGFQALQINTIGGDNTASGFRALVNHTTGQFNTAIGSEALFFTSTGGNNIGVGFGAGRSHTTGSDNIAIGNIGVPAESATIRIGSLQTRAFISGISGVMTEINDAVPVLIDSAGQLGVVSSSQRYKDDIEDMAEASEGLLSLRPVTFRYKQAFEDGDKPIQYGLIAEEVAEVFPDLVVYNEQGEPETVKYHLLATLLLNEFQKLEHVTADQEAQLVSLVEQNRAYESERERLATVEVKLAELTALTARLTQSIIPDRQLELASN